MFSNAENASITAGGALSPEIGAQGIISFADEASAGNAALTANGGVNGGDGGLIAFSQRSTGGTAQVRLYGNGRLYLGGKANPVLTIGSLEGEGVVELARTNLSIGSNSLSTLYSGVIQDGTAASGGALTKIGTGVLTLTGANSYTGGTTVTEGTLVLRNTSGSATGSGPVTVRAGTLAGNGAVAGAVTVGAGNGTGAFLAPSNGARKPATLTVVGGLTFKADATYNYLLQTKGRRSRTDLVVANGVTIANGATFNLTAQINGTVQVGSSYTVLSNTSATPISGRFSNLPDRSILRWEAFSSKRITTAVTATISRWSWSRLRRVRRREAGARQCRQRADFSRQPMRFR